MRTQKLLNIDVSHVRDRLPDVYVGTYVPFPESMNILLHERTGDDVKEDRNNHPGRGEKTVTQTDGAAAASQRVKRVEHFQP